MSSSANSNLLHAAEAGSVARIDAALKAGANIEHRDLNNRAALHFAAINGYGEAVSYLISAGAKVDATGTNARTALISACSSYGAEPAIHVLLKAGALVTARDAFKHTSLAEACFNGQPLSVIHALCAAGADAKAPNVIVMAGSGSSPGGYPRTCRSWGRRQCAQHQRSDGTAYRRQ